jgi:hypothetical protein
VNATEIAQAAANLTRSEAVHLFLKLDGVKFVRRCTLDTDDDSSDVGPVRTWVAEVRGEGDEDHDDADWYVATMPDHWPDGAEVDWFTPV